ncbi:phage pi2 protein 07 [Staphylococcus hominis]
MSQTLTVTIPDTHVLIPKVELEKLISKTLPITWTMEDLIKESKLSRYLIFKRILEVPRFNKYLKENDIWFEGQGGSSSHYFDAELMWKFLKDYKKEIYNG